MRFRRVAVIGVVALGLMVTACAETPRVDVQAPLDRVAAVIARNPVLQTLFGNEWVSLVVLDPADAEPQRYLTGGEWRPWFAHAGETADALPPTVDLSDTSITISC